MAVKTKDYEVIKESSEELYDLLGKIIETDVKHLEKNIKPDRLETEIRESLAASIAVANVTYPDGKKLHSGGGASHLWVSNVETNERIFLIRFTNEY